MQIKTNIPELSDKNVSDIIDKLAVNFLRKPEAFKLSWKSKLQKNIKPTEIPCDSWRDDECL